MTHATTIRTTSTARRRSSSGGRRRAAPRLRPGRLAVLALVLIAAAFYVSPLRAFFAQQDRYQKAAASLAAARAENAALDREVELLSTDAYLAQRARSDELLVPPGTQVFVIKGLPGERRPSAGTQAPPVESSISVLDRLEDLWRTLQR